LLLKESYLSQSNQDVAHVASLKNKQNKLKVYHQFLGIRSFLADWRLEITLGMSN